ncbi:hypothetical protein ILUMI_09823 [Ignelater luminosus]|uniref:Mediator of RNA polymerase II transcription subunit 26 n=1 Tax=Ignelater luminosus TaxID=2038154 RepID=A0A8K0CZ20_IGNLU|nr:hypothetical protein ILUMI_09823 [Ignelater luminosus]
MQNNVTELTQKLLRSLDSNYNVIDMPAVIEIISLLEKVSITKELLETTRLGKHVNQLRRNTNNESLAKRAKDLVRKWRDMVLPDSNGQLKSAPNDSHPQEDMQSKKRPAKEPLENSNIKRSRMNGQMSELDFSDNSNSSFKDVITSKSTTKSVIIINSDSNSSMPDTKQEPLLEQQQPKKRGRKKGSKNHKNLIEEAETSFSNKLNVSRGNAKVKTTQELLADLHIRSNNSTLSNTSSKPIEDLNERAAKLTERVSIIDQKLNANSNRYRNSQKKFNLNKSNVTDKGEIIESGMVSNLKNAIISNASPNSKGSESYPNLKTALQANNTPDDEIIIVDDNEAETERKVEPKSEVKVEEEQPVVPKSLTVEEALALLPPIDRSVLDEKDPQPQCSCQLIENKTDFSVEDDEEVNLQHTFEFVEDSNCSAKSYLIEKYHLDSEMLDERVQRLHAECTPNVNGNYGVGSCKNDSQATDENGLYVNVVPNVNTENLPKFSSIDYTQPASENFKKYSISEKLPGSNNKCVEGVAKNDNCELNSTVQNGGSDSNNGNSDTQTFREWHEVLETPSYNGEILKILPYVIID